MITLSIDVTQIDKSRLKEITRKNGQKAKFLELILIETPDGQYGDLYRPADIGCEGMTLRDWFAGQASESDVMHWRNAVGVGCTREMAKYAYADAMLAAQKGGAR